MATPNYAIDENDKRLVEVNTNKQEALTANETTYNDAINGVDAKYDALIENSENWAEEQAKIQNEQTDFAIEKIEQEKEQTKKDYIKEQSGAFVDYQKEKDSYGVGAEQRAAAGLAGAGYSESAQVSIYNTYQNRVATAREALVRANLNYDNAMKEARLQNSSVLAEIAFKAKQEQYELALQGFQYKNTLIIEKANKQLEIENMFHNQYMSVLDQINKENALAEEVRQHNESLAAQKAYQNAQLALEREKFNYQKAQAATSSKGSSSSSKKSSAARSSGSARKAYANRGFTGSTYSEAVAYMEKNGVDGGYASNVMTKGEFARANASGGKRGDAGNYSTYTDYLKAFVNHAINS